MRQLKRDIRKEKKESIRSLEKWELKLLLSLIILLIMATIVDLNIDFEQVLKFMLN